eukprot:363421-Chlamydomonas_euryale.AAC.3
MSFSQAGRGSRMMGTGVDAQASAWVCRPHDATQVGAVRLDDDGHALTWMPFKAPCEDAQRPLQQLDINTVPPQTAAGPPHM